MAAESMEAGGVSEQAVTGAMASASELAARVCHEEQMVVWSGEVMGSLSVGGFLREDWSYEDTINAGEAVTSDLRSIVESAFDHPELKGAALAFPPPAVPESVRRDALRLLMGETFTYGVWFADPGLGIDGEHEKACAEAVDKALEDFSDEVRTLLATPSGRADAPPDGDGAVPEGWVMIPECPGDSAVNAFEMAYWRKAEDARSPTPTEHPEDGGGPFGYGFRALLKAVGAASVTPAPASVASNSRTDEIDRAIVAALGTVGVEGEVDRYEFRGDDGDHTPTADERALLVDFAYGLMLRVHEAVRPLVLAAAPTAPEPAGMGGPFRVGRKVARHVYEGDEPLFTAASDEAAARYVRLLNGNLPAVEDADAVADLRARLDRAERALRPFTKLSFSFDGFSFDPAELVVLGECCGRFSCRAHSHLSDAIDEARAASPADAEGGRS